MDDYPQIPSVFPGNASLFSSSKGYEVVMAAYDAEVARAPVPYQSQLVSTRYGATHILSGGSRDAPPVFLFHHWRANAAGIGASFPFLFLWYRVYTPDIIDQMGKSSQGWQRRSSSHFSALLMQNRPDGERSVKSHFERSTRWIS